MTPKEEVVEAMFEMITDWHGKKNAKAMDLIKAMRAKFGEDKCNKKLCKEAIRELIDEGRCVYSYVGGSYIVLPPEDKK
jgi:hypothetical protein